jgi:hypothetical protein
VFGILTLVGMEVHITGSLSGTFEWRFRNPMITTENVFDQTTVSSNGVDYPLDTSPFTSRVNLNGNVFRLGFGWAF